MTRAFAFAFALAACSDDAIDPITKITGPRVLAIASEPPVLAVDGEVVVTPLTVDDRGPRIGVGASTPPGGRPAQAIRVRACTPWKFVADPARDCAGADALPLATAGDGRFTLSTTMVLAAFPMPDRGTPTAEDLRAALAAGLELRIPVVAEIDIDGETLVARRDLWIVDEVGELQDPRIAEVQFDGDVMPTLRTGRRYTLTVAIDPASIDRVPDGDPAAAPFESLDCHFYSTTGELADHQVDVDPEVSFASESTEYTAGDSGEAWLYVVVTDRTGGMAVDWVPLIIE
jgi:hypothetical protein